MEDLETADLTIRSAETDDLSAIVALLADDPLGAQRESPDDLTPYLAAFERLAEDPNQRLVVAVRKSEVVGTLQLTIVPGLSRKGSTRSIIEAVRIRGDERGSGLGTRFIEWAVAESRREGCQLVQLTSDATRVDAHRFYERLGFEASHVGFKLAL
ncbi:GNAT family N-acetyltransferase [Streptomyces acidiscabies]|uniref:GNAT family N-acetyltransferase n=1 Tax=Streptomyces acidiscabies TaxID=42234 RepID=A0AAP6EHF0_9ACTN|nr:GNAT family N-acetyltransferase [Streptomyces acidiscabies]MBP5938403.1 GNAT family N-acetyltransferase [Streptomyces sp. LBUM 1476]MBZ3909502.1 GNAT family N-acetyltransferase [Streptomyces acidiscabies]MDX2962330.1 GNAT family N-acetyltransferase [Streptomyces acidiscabies]MDX3019782.1 GNAT family N-acetyltransferase [Streptomyces acidiscabies]MDX3792349.1 GNAT family N-acetyltransferase [Streptomyces acidiscabies]